MKRTLRLIWMILFFALAEGWAQNTPTLNVATAQEKHLRNVHQLTFGGSNAEAYFSADGKKLIYQSSHGDVKCDQIFIMNIDGSGQHAVSTGKGRTTCSYFYPTARRFCTPRRIWRARVPAAPGFLEGLCLGGIRGI
jgi:hypothetical protein